MISLAIDENNNLVVGRNFGTKNGNECLIQDMKTALSLQQGEYPFNINKGINYLDYLQQNRQQFLLSQIVSTCLNDVRVSKVDLDVSKNNKSLEIKILTTKNEEVVFELD